MHDPRGSCSESWRTMGWSPGRGWPSVAGGNGACDLMWGRWRERGGYLLRLRTEFEKIGGGPNYPLRVVAPGEVRPQTEAHTHPPIVGYVKVRSLSSTAG